MRARTWVAPLSRFPIIGFLLLAVVAVVATTVFRFSQAKEDGPPAIRPLNPLQQENQRPGTTAWEPTSPAHLAPYDPKTFRTPAIEGYAWATSAQAGERLRFSVSTTTASFTAAVYRL